MNNNKKILLHVCCATCAAGCVETLREQGFEEIVFFEYNPNIFPFEEYEKRVFDLKRLSRMKGIPYHSLPYDHLVWLKEAGHLKDEKEGGKRCDLCFRLRLREAAKKAKELDIGFFTSTLSISPHKDFQRICSIGRDAGQNAGVGFLAQDFKKKDGFKKSLELSKKNDFYRQNYCGCEFSIRK